MFEEASFFASLNDPPASVPLTATAPSAALPFPITAKQAAAEPVVPAPEPSYTPSEQAAAEVAVDQAETLYNPLERGICVIIKRKKWGVERDADMSLIDTEADKEWMAGTKQIIDCEEYTKIKQYLRSMDKWVSKVASRSLLQHGCWAMTQAAVLPFMRQMKEYQQGLSPLVEAFLAVYPAQKLKARAHLRNQFNEDDYPTVDELRGMFAIHYKFVKFGTPIELSEIDPALFEEEKRKFAEDLMNAGQDIIKGLRAEFYKHLSNLVDKCTPRKEGERKKILKDAAVDNFTDYLRFFDFRNLGDDKRLADMVARARQALLMPDGSLVDPEALRGDDGLKTKLREKLSAIEQDMDKLLVTQGTRKIMFADAE